MSKQHTSSCSRCGFCLAICPVYNVTMEEHTAPRAKVHLIKAYKDKQLPSSSRLKELVSQCLMCGSCTANCPSGVDHYPQFIEMRREMLKDHGDIPEIRSLVYLLAREHRLKIATGMARLGQSLIPDTFLKKYNLAEIPLNNLPKLNSKPFRSMVDKHLPAIGKERGKVLYFTGCATNHVFAQTGLATTRLLTRMGYAVHIPEKQTCCSIPLLYHGAVDQAEHNIQINLACLNNDEYEAIIVDCPTCGTALKKDYPAIISQSNSDNSVAKTVAAKVTDLMSFVYDRLDQLDIRQPKDNAPRITYHAPCHLKNSISQADRILRAVAPNIYIPAVDSEECCGGGGTFFYEYPEISGKMSQQKIANARKTGAELWLTDCPVCKINLSGRLEAGDTLQVMHPAQYLESLLVASPEPRS